MIPQTSNQYRDVGRALRITAMAQRYLPRGKGAAPRWIGKLLGKRPRYLVTKHGARLVMAPDAWDVYSTMALNNGSWDYDDFATCVNGTPEAGVFYDIGANVGYFSVEMAHLCGPSVKVVAFEPQSRLVEAIQASAELNGLDNLETFCAMVGDRARQATLHLARATIHASALADSGRKSVGTVPVQMVTIDELVGGKKVPPPDMVKIDVEGGEHLVLEGARNTFRQFRPHIFLEYLEWADKDLRVRAEVNLLLGDRAEYELFGYSSSADRSPPWFRIGNGGEWSAVDGLFLKNTRRPVRKSESFES